MRALPVSVDGGPPAETRGCDLDFTKSAHDLGAGRGVGFSAVTPSVSFVASEVPCAAVVGVVVPGLSPPSFDAGRGTPEGTMGTTGTNGTGCLAPVADVAVGVRESAGAGVADDGVVG